MGVGMRLRRDSDDPVEDVASVHNADAADNGGRPGPSIAAPARSQLGALLVGSQLITHEQLADALIQQQAGSGKRIGTTLVELGAISERDLAQALSNQLLVPLVDLSQQTPSPEAVEVLSESVARAHLAVPIALDGNAVTIAVSDPNPELAKALANSCGRIVRLVIAPRSDIQRAIDTSYRALGNITEHVRAFEETAETTRRQADTAVQTVNAGDAPVVQVVNLLITQAMRDRASDIHVEPQDERLRVRYRIDGALHDAIELPIAMAPALVSRLKIMADMNIVERRRPQDGQITMQVDGREIDIRVSTVATIWGESCVLRVLDKSRSVFRMADLGMPVDTHEVLARLVRAPFGMVLCAGPTGSGKTTTLYAALTEIDDPSRNIMTIEDPVEYVFPSINQIQTNEQAGITFANGLRSILRQDPDVILVGEIRDVETARIAVQSALTGHLVLSSLHATDSAAALHRFLDMGIESFLVASSVLAVVSQRLVRRVCQTCMAPYEPKDEELAFYFESGGPEKSRFFQGEGCNFCAGTGYRDRIGVFELMRITPEIKRLIVGWATQEELQRMAVSQGMRTLRDEAIQLVSDDVTTISEVVRSIYAA
ncbi:MAG TPA: GspE/PulE family protein [Acidimicrobiales bacterium]|nr:GspE/PulE family protein [Acidimicrobiales bacterium]